MIDRQPNSEPDFERVQQGLLERLPRNQRVRRNLPGNGRLRIDRQLPFLCVYRIPPDRDDGGTRDFVTTEAAYLVAPGDDQYAQPVASLCDLIGQMMVEHFGVFLFLEIWSGEADEATRYPVRPHFQIVIPADEQLPTMVDAFHEGLAAIEIGSTSATVSVETVQDVCPRGLGSLLQGERRAQYVTLGLEISPIYRQLDTGAVFPILVHQLRGQLAAAIRKAVTAFVGARSSGSALKPPASYGPSSMVKAVREVDQQLSEVSAGFDFLFQVTPVNSDASWVEFEAGGFQIAPRLYYRPLPYHPNVLKRRLFEVPIERVEDPILAHLFWEKQSELDRQLSALRDLDTPHFLSSSLQLYGGIEPQLLEAAQQILDRCRGERAASPVSRNEIEPALAVVADQLLGPEQIAQSAREEIDYYHARSPGFLAGVKLSDEITAGMMVSRETLLISRNLSICESRLAPLLHHEVGTHLLTYFNGRNQPFRQLATGLAGYDGLQEGLAVLSEYLSGGLTLSRIRTLAGRVVAVWTMTQGSDFLDTFRLLHHEYEFSARSAYTMTLRVHRGGGLTKDAVYLRGLQQLLSYLSEGHELEPLFVGKIALAHVPFVQELRRRGIIQPPTVLPRYYAQTNARERLERCRSRSVLDLLEFTP